MRSIPYLFLLAVVPVCALTTQSPLPKISIATTRLFSKEERQREILNQLDENYQYEGRLPSGGKDHRCGFACIVGAPNMGKVSVSQQADKMSPHQKRMALIQSGTHFIQ
jgi:hypothetical protein